MRRVSRCSVRTGRCDLRSARMRTRPRLIGGSSPRARDRAWTWFTRNRVRRARIGWSLPWTFRPSTDGRGGFRPRRPWVTGVSWRCVLFTDHAAGSISLYASQPRVLDGGALENARIVAAVASVVLTQVCTEQELRRAVHSRGVIGQAQGMLMQRYGLTAEPAFVVLRRYSQLRNTTLVVLAEQFTTTGVLPDLPGPHHGHERMP